MKFSIRDLLLVTLIVALAVGWWVDRSRLATENGELHRMENSRAKPSPLPNKSPLLVPTSLAPAPNPPKK